MKWNLLRNTDLQDAGTFESVSVETMAQGKIFFLIIKKKNQNNSKKIARNNTHFHFCI